MSISGYLVGAPQNSDLWMQIARLNSGDYLHQVQAYKAADQATLTAATDVSGLALSMKQGAKYGFGFDVMYSVTGALVSVQWALTFTGTAVTFRAGLTGATMANALVSDSTNSLGTAFGASTSVVGGTNVKTIRVFGSIETGTPGGDLVLRTIPVGLGASVSVYVGSVATASEM